VEIKMSQVLQLCKYSGECEDFCLQYRRCVNGGGTGCKVWRRKTDVEMFGEAGAQMLRKYSSW
jgi:hypothetical protein